MNPDIYNERVANFQIRVKNLQTEIIEKKITMENFFQLQTIMQKVSLLWKECESIFYNIKNPKSQDLLLVYLENETEFLKILTSLLNNIEHYHKVVGEFIEKSEIQKIWEDVYKVVILQDSIQKYNRGLEIVTEKINKFSKKERQVLFQQEYSWLSDRIKMAEGEKTEAINRIEELESKEERNINNTMFSESEMKRISLEKELKEKSKEALNSFENFFDKIDVVSEQKIPDFTEEEQKELRKEDVQVDEAYLNTLSLPLQIEYVQSVMETIEKVKGKKVTVKYKGVSKRISKKKNCVSSWLRCQTILRSLTMKYDEQVVQLADEMEKEDALRIQQAKEEYASLYEKLLVVENCLFKLAESAKEFLGTKEVVAVSSFNKEPLYIHKKSLDRFNAYFVEYKRLQKEINRFLERHDLKEVPPVEKFEEIQTAKYELYNQISFLNEQKEKLNPGENVDELNSQISKLRKELYKMNKGHKFAIFANLKVLFKSLRLSDDISSFYASIAENPEKFRNSKKYKANSKKEILQDILTKIQNSCLLTKEDVNEKINENKKKINDSLGIQKKKDFLREQFSKVRREFCLFPKKEKKCTRIKRIKDSINKKKLVGSIASTVILCCSVSGLLYLQNDSVEAHEKRMESTLETTEFKEYAFENSHSDNFNFSNTFAIHQMESIEEQQVKEAPGKENYDKQMTFKSMPKKETFSYDDVLKEIDFGDTFTKQGSVYRTAEEAVTKQNPYSTYFDKDSLSTVEGIVYKYNDTFVPIYSSQEDSESLRIAMVNNGAEPVGVLGQNEHTTTNDYEGYFSIDDIQFVLNEETELMNERGR